MKIFKNIFRRKKQEGGGEPAPLRIEGIPPAPMTAEPDNAELAAQALLESLSPNPSPKGVGSNKTEPKAGTAEYYQRLAEKIRSAQEASRLRALRFVAFVEQELEKPHLPVSGAGSLGLLEAELMKRIDVIERVGGELKTRWQHCLATVTVRLMQAGPKLSDEYDTTTDDAD